MNRSLMLHRLLPPAYAAYVGVQAWRTDSQIASEQRQYESRNSAPDPESVAQRLKARLQARGMTVAAKSIGQIHALFATAPSNWERHNIPPQLAMFGEVTCYFYQERGYDEGVSTWLEKRRDMNADLLAFVRDVHKRKPIDVFLGYLSGWQVAPEVLREIAGMGIVVCGFNWDDKLAFRGRFAGGRWSGPAAVAAAYDLSLTNAASSIIKYEGEGGLAMFWPEGANPQHFRPLDREYGFDVSFVGACYGYRPILIERLRKRGVQVHTFGPGWPSGPIPEQDMVEIYARSKINLGFGGIGYSRKSQCLKGRDFEVPMCGALYLTSANPELDSVYAVGQEIDVYRDADDCLDKIHYLLAHPEHAEQVRRAGREKCLASHTWEKRFAELFRVIGYLQ